MRTVKTKPLTWRPRANDWLAGHEQSGSYLLIDDQGKAVIQDLQQRTVAQTQKRHPDADVKHIIEQLKGKDLLEKIDHRVVTKHAHITDTINIPVAVAKKITEPIGLGIILGIILAGIYTAITKPWLLPGPKAFFATTSYAALIPLAFIIWWIIQYIHESAHYLALRRTGHPTGLAIVHKWHLLLPAANIENERLLPTTQRVAVHLAGIIADLTILSISILALQTGYGGALFSLVALLALLDILAQLIPIAKTDLTVAIEHATNVEGLPGALWKTISNALGITRYNLTRKEIRGADRFLPWAFIGLFVLALFLGAYVIPMLIALVAGAALTAINGATQGVQGAFFDGALAIAMIATFTSMYAIATIRQHELSARSWFTWVGILIHLAANTTLALVLSAASILYLSPPLAAGAHIILGILFGMIFIKLLDAIHIEETGFAHDFLLPIIAAASALVLTLMTAYIAAHTGGPAPDGIYGIAYAVGMLFALVL